MALKNRSLLQLLLGKKNEAGDFHAVGDEKREAYRPPTPAAALIPEFAPKNLSISEEAKLIAQRAVQVKIGDLIRLSSSDNKVPGLLKELDELRKGLKGLGSDLTNAQIVLIEETRQRYTNHQQQEMLNVLNKRAAANAAAK